jgi:hypothetical protein
METNSSGSAGQPPPAASTQSRGRPSLPTSDQWNEMSILEKFKASVRGVLLVQTSLIQSSPVPLISCLFCASYRTKEKNTFPLWIFLSTTKKELSVP